MNYVGIDLHKEKSWFYVMDDTGKCLDSKNILNQKIILEDYFSKIPKPFAVAVETTYNWNFIINLANHYTDKYFLANSYELKAFAKRNKKTDKIDAKLIANILRQGFLPIVYIPDEKTIRIKDYLAYRINLIRERTRKIVRLKGLLDKLGFISSGNYTTHKKLDTILLSNKIPEGYIYLIKKQIEEIKEMTNKITKFEKEFYAEIANDEEINYLMSIPGISYFSAAIIKSEIADINRFKTFNKLCSYAGLAPKVAQSANTIRYGGLNKNRCKNLQWILLEIVLHYIKAQPEKLEKFNLMKKRKNHNTAKVAMARDMLKIIFKVLKEKRAFYFNKNNENKNEKK